MSILPNPTSLHTPYEHFIQHNFIKYDEKKHYRALKYALFRKYKRNNIIANLTGQRYLKGSYLIRRVQAYNMPRAQGRFKTKSCAIYIDA
jgi:hypothetical protein